MRIHFSIWACLVLFAVNTVSANTSTTLSSGANEDEKTAAKEEKATTKEEIKTIPNRALALTLNSKNKTLGVHLSGKVENLEWVIFQPKGKVISRISTSSRIDEIKVDNLTPGKYVLMIKDSENRRLFKAFELN